MDAKIHGDSHQCCGQITETHTNVVEKSNPDLNTHILYIFSTTMLILLKQASHLTGAAQTVLEKQHFLQG